MDILKQAKENFLNKEKDLSPYACKSLDAIRLRKEKEDIRPPYFHDTDRIIHSLSYTRYVDKTQVFTRSENDHVSKRITHVQLVSKIARTIGRALSLNEDLIEAIALGHDIGHTPLGHVGEAILNEISRRELGEAFAHNIQSVRHLMIVEHEGLGLNLSIQVLDGIMCHNGEMLDSTYVPMKKTKEEFLKEYHDSYLHFEDSVKNRPMTLEGCVVRISDIIAYIGRDIEDAIKLGIITRNSIPRHIVDVLGNSNSTMVNTLVRDIVVNSYEKQYIELSKYIFEALMELKRWNYKNIYESESATKNHNILENLFRNLFDAYFDKLVSFDYTLNTKINDNMEYSEKVFYEFLNDKSYEYLKNTNPKRIVVDYIAGQTDKFFLSECEEHVYGFRRSMLY